VRPISIALVCLGLAACGTGFSVGVTVDVQCMPAPVAIEVTVTAQPGGQHVMERATDPAELRRIVVIPPVGASSLHITARALDAMARQRAYGELDVAVAGHRLIELALPIVCGSCAPACAEPGLCCATSCVNPEIDSKNCGGCGLGCALPRAQSSCASSACRVDLCEPGWADCDGKASTGCEVDTSDPTQGCGCASPCSSNNISPTCAAGMCTGACNPGWGDCDLDRRGNGCETSLSVDPMNCGACAHRCSSGRCDAGVCAKRIFVSSALYTGALGGLAGADQKCQALADAVPLGGTWRAWLSTGDESVLVRFGAPGPGAYFRIDGSLITESIADLLSSGGPKVAIDVTEKGQPAPVADASGCFNASKMQVWTNTTSSGLPSGTNDCAGWMSTGASTLVWIGDAKPVLLQYNWTSACFGSCDKTAALYCFEQ